ncbi:MAG: tetraacyldisaccharide 4'-kinase [Candidatus Kappaea frigidicola]|nr:tetraacyldisaccharide 4'-kinase [Candidatus Kappaea frigidicola]
MKLKEYLYQVTINGKRGPFAFLVRLFLLLLSCIYFVLVKALVFIYTSGLTSRVTCKKKIISIGNITAGGTGKTPFEMFLVNNFLAQKKVVIISRGYNNDELDLLQYNLPKVKILSGRNRIQLIEKAQKIFDPDIIILDDGFQQWRIKKDIEIVLIDSSNPFSNNKLLPAGLLREPLSSLSRADIFVLTKADECPEGLTSIRKLIQNINHEALVLECNHKASEIYEPISKNNLNIELLKNKKVFTFCAIGSAESFRRTLKNLEVNIVGYKDYLDHHQYTNNDIDIIIRAAAASKTEVIITTEKDWMRLDANMIWQLSNGHKFYLLKIDIELIGKKEILNEKLSQLFNH